MNEQVLLDATAWRPATADEAAQRGAAVLDVIKPDWYFIIGEVDMESPWDCVIGQVYGQGIAYAEVQYTVAKLIDPENSALYYGSMVDGPGHTATCRLMTWYGFLIRSEYGLPYTYVDLDRAWAREIQNRRP